MNQVVVQIIKLWVRFACFPAASVFKSFHYELHSLVKIPELFRFRFFVSGFCLFLFLRDDLHKLTLRYASN